MLAVGTFTVNIDIALPCFGSSVVPPVFVVHFCGSFLWSFFVVRFVVPFVGLFVPQNFVVPKFVTYMTYVAVRWQDLRKQ